MIGKETMRAAVGFLAERLSGLVGRLLGLGEAVRRRVAEAVGAAADEAARAAVRSLLGCDADHDDFDDRRTPVRESFGREERREADSWGEPDRRYVVDEYDDAPVTPRRAEVAWGEGLLAATQAASWLPGRPLRALASAATAGGLAVLTGMPALACAAAAVAFALLTSAFNG